MQEKTARRVLAILVIGFGVAVPLTNALLDRVPSVSPAFVREELARAPGKNLLVDIRRDAVYAVPGCADVLRESTLENLDPGLLHAKEKVFLLCNTGWASSVATRQLRQKGFANVYSVRGGLEAWLSGMGMPCRTGQNVPLAVCTRDGSGATVRRVGLTGFEQFIICFASFGLKPLYELLALLVAIVVWKRPGTHWRVLRWAMVAFFLGENACAVNYLFYDLENFTWEFWHCYGMLVSFGLTSYAVLHFVDHDLIHYSQKEKPCGFVPLCANCYKYKPVACNLWVLFLFAIPALIILGFLPLSAGFRDFMSVGTVYGSDVLFTHSLKQQFYEIRVYPILAMFFLACAWIVLLRGKEPAMEPSKLFFAAGLGILGFSLTRFLLYWSLADKLLWAEAWEEITEFMFILAIIILLCVKRIGHRLRPGIQGDGCQTA